MDERCDHMRSAGILLHISSLPSPYGIGTLGREAYAFADFLHAAGQTYWQLLPIGPTGYGDSPYQSVSTFAGNPYFIDPELLMEEGLLTREELNTVPNRERVDYGELNATRYPLLRKAFSRGKGSFDPKAYMQEHPWVENYALFMAIKEHRHMASWDQWPAALRLREPDALALCREEYKEDIAFYIFLQYHFTKQWTALRAYVHSLGIRFIGDLPIYVPYDSCDVWAAPGLFQLDERGLPTAVAGCPPDAFSAEGQLWGNPLYRWDRMAQDDFAWWRLRLQEAGKRFDVIRLDHFRGLSSYWSVPYGDRNAIGGKWVKGPGEAFFRSLQTHLPHLRLIAEDLGYLTPEIPALRKFSGYPGMKILEFAFDPREPGNYLPHTYDRNSVCYSGTHDNETLFQWQGCVGEEGLRHAMTYLGLKDRAALHWAILRLGMASVSDTFIAQMQDYLELGGEARMNTPGLLSPQNWSWRMNKDALTPHLAHKLRTLTQLYERL